MERKSRETKNIGQQIKQLTALILENRKNVNCIVDIINKSETDDSDVLVACVKAFCQVFVAFIDSSEMYLEQETEVYSDTSASNKEVQLKVWLRQRYEAVCERLLQLLYNQDTIVQELALCTLMRLVKAEGIKPLRKLSKKQLYFPAKFFQRILEQLVSEEDDFTLLLGRFEEYLEFDDVRYYVLKFLLAAIAKKQTKVVEDIFLRNVFALLENMAFSSTSDGPLTNFLSKPPEDETTKICSLQEQKKLFTTVWLTFLKFKLSTSLYRKVLLILHDKVMPYMTSPLLLSDFLTNSYNIGGAISLLSLNGLFILVNKYNLNYPDFYGKLYALFEPNVFHVKYKARFFFLADLFLTSTHLPAYLVAAFVKRLARIVLTAPPTGQMLAIPFIYNLIYRHPSCKVLLHRPDGPKDIEEDVYRMDEPDPVKCCALESSLWEIKTLQNHYHPDVSAAAQKIEHPLQEREEELKDLLELTGDNLFEKEMKKKMKTVPMTFDPPKGLFTYKDDKMSQCWSLE
ncbi:hypothetical protein ScPMuIL_006783 [Solemya velum]